MQVTIVQFPETRVAVAEHRGPMELEHQTSRRLIAWRQENSVRFDAHQTYGIHYTNPLTTAPADHRVDFCVSYAADVASNSFGIISKVIPAIRCAMATHHGSRALNTAAAYLHQEWLPVSGESCADFPVFFHYVNVGPNVEEKAMITDVYLPLRN